MTMKVIKERQQVRRLFTRNIAKLEDDVKKGTVDLTIEIEYLRDKIERLRQLNKTVQDALLETEEEDVLNKEFDECDEYEQMRHPYILCPNLHITTSKELKNKEISSDLKSDKCIAVNSFSSSNKAVTLLQTLVVVVKGDIKEKKLRVLLDSGSQKSYVKVGVADELGLQVKGKERLGHCLFGGVQSKQQIHRVIELKVRDPSLLHKLKNRGIVLTDGDEDITEVSILIGSDWLGSILENEIVKITDNLVASKTKLGWAIQGPHARCV
ncbi:hypothetical protein ACJJTC_008929 [Scirpophaga incertulas]